MKRIGLIFLFLMLCGNTASAMLIAQAVTEPAVQTPPTGTEVSPATETEKPAESEEPAMEMAAPDEPAAMPLEVDEEPSAATASPSTPPLWEGKWQGERRVLKIVNDYQLTADEVVTTLVVIAGNATLHGTVTGNVLVLGGDVALTPTAQIDGTLRVIGGQVSGGTGMERHIYVHNGWRVVPAGTRILMQPQTVWGISKRGNLWLTGTKFGISCLTYLLLALIFSQQLQRMVMRMSEHPVGTVLCGILMLVFIPVLLGILTLSIVGIPCMFLVLGVLFGMAIYGKTAFFLLIGGTLLSGRLKPLAVIFGYILYFMATSVPYIDWVTFLVVNSIAVGICLLSGTGQQSARLVRNAYTPRPAVHY